MDAIYDGKSAAAGDDAVVSLDQRLEGRANDHPAPTTAFVGHDRQELINEFTLAISDADSVGVRFLRGAILSRMDAGDLSSLAALRLLLVCDARATAIERPR
jgi:hypothetical protein